MAGVVQFVFDIEPSFGHMAGEKLLAAEGYQVDPARLELHIKALNYAEEHPGTSYPAALNIVGKEQVLSFSEAPSARIMQIHTKAVGSLRGQLTEID